MRSRLLVVTLFALGVLLAVPAAGAKDLRPGDLRVCGRTHCVPIVNPRLLRILSSYYWGPARVRRAPRVRAGARGFELRWRNGHASGVVATRGLVRFRAFGFFCGRFVRGTWYRLPAEAAHELTKLTAGSEPMRVSLRPPRSC
jgi:hypothetical protein